jgi:HAD superfamily hydrolase (TIGR01509 family)
VWLRYYAIVLGVLGVIGDVDALAEAITARWETSVCVAAYPWTMPVLRELQRRAIPVVVLSDAWPSLRRVYRQLGLDGYVRAMVVSGEEGITKPDERVFNRALVQLGRAVTEVVFVDDWFGHVHAAEQLGLRGVHLWHGDDDPPAGGARITDLRAVLPLLGSPPLRRSSS